MKYHFTSLGCPKNLVDSEVFTNILAEFKLEKTTDKEDADFQIINTCGFIQSAKEEAIDEILEAVETSKSNNSKIIVTGCFVKRYKEELINEIPEVEHYIDLKDFQSFAEIFENEFNTKYHKTPFERDYLTPSHYGYLRVSDGCENYCAYCAIPLIRGKIKSESIESLVKEATKMVNSGVKELIITAQDTTLYGIDLYGKPKLDELLTELNKIQKLKWIRLLYLHPAHLTFENIDTFKRLEKVLPYFDIPLQHISDKMLKAMNRHVSKDRILDILNYIRKTITDSTIRTTFITGFPGETIKDFRELRDFIKDFKFDKLGVFNYSQEEDTPAFNFDNKVTEKTALKRKDELMMIQQEISESLLEKQVGKTLEVVIEDISQEEGIIFEGRSIYDAPEIDGTVFITEGKAAIGDIKKVKIIDSWEYDLVGKIL